MKTLLKIVIGIAVAFVLAVGAMFWMTSGLVGTADGFFKAVRAENLGVARDFLSEDFRASTDEATLREFLTRSAILHFKEAHWSNRQISFGRGELNGSVQTDSGGVVPIKLIFVKERGDWKIYGIQKPTAGLQSADTSPTMPSESAQMELVKLSMHDFVVSLNTKSMAHFRETIAPMWQRQATVGQLDNTFGKLYGFGAALTVLEGLNPIMEGAPTIDDQGILKLTGYYPTHPDRVSFEQQFVYTGISWKLVGFSINSSRPHQPAQTTGNPANPASQHAL
jgi:hypothetical protein